VSTFKKLFTLLLFAMISTTAFAISNAQFFAFAAANYPSLFSGTATAGQYQAYDFRYYSASGNYLVVDTAGVAYILGPYTNGAIISVGPVSAFATAITAWEATSASYMMGGAIQGTPVSPYTNVVTTIAGTAGSPGSADSTGTAARFHSPWGITTEGTDLYIADSLNNTIRKRDISTGVVTTIAGTAGSTGSADGTGTAARFHTPAGITTDGTNLYVAENGNGTIRKIVMSTGVVTTIAGTAGSYGSADGTGAAARFSYNLTSITTDGTNLYVTDNANSTIRKIVISSGVVTTIAGMAGSSGETDGTGSAARFQSPFGITTDGTNLYVADFAYGTIRRIVISTGVVTTIAGGGSSSGSMDGTGSAASFDAPAGMTTDGTNLYVAESGNDTIRKVVLATGAVTTIAGTAGSYGSTDGTGSAARFQSSLGITTDGTNLYVADSGNNTIRKISAITTAPSSAPTGVTATAGNGQTIFTWNPVSGATGYNIYCAPGTSVTVTTGIKIAYVVASQYQLGDIVRYAYPGVSSVTYTCIVTAVNDFGEGTASSPISPTPPPTCSNGATDYPTCTPPTCSNGATDYPTCTPPTCSNGATDYPTCTPPTCSNGATNYPTCTATGGTGYFWANWSCGSSSQCASLMGAFSGSAGPMCSLNSCSTWGNRYIQGGYSCSTTASSANRTTGTPSNGTCYQSGVDF